MKLLEKIKEILFTEWRKDKTINIPLESKRIQQGTELMKLEIRQRFIDEFTSIANKKSTNAKFTRGMFGLDEKRILEIIESM